MFQFISTIHYSKNFTRIYLLTIGHMPLFVVKYFVIQINSLGYGYITSLIYWLDDAVVITLYFLVWCDCLWDLLVGCYEAMLCKPLETNAGIKAFSVTGDSCVRCRRRCKPLETNAGIKAFSVTGDSCVRGRRRCKPLETNAGIKAFSVTGDSCVRGRRRCKPLETNAGIKAFSITGHSCVRCRRRCKPLETNAGIKEFSVTGDSCVRGRRSCTYVWHSRCGSRDGGPWPHQHCDSCEERSDGRVTCPPDGGSRCFPSQGNVISFIHMRLMFAYIARPLPNVSVCEWVNSVWNRSIPRAFTNSLDFKYSRMYIQLHPSVSMKSDLNHIAVYHLWGYTYDLGEILWKLRCMVKCSRSTVI